MRLPNGLNAFVDDAKLVEYCLNPNHPRGKHKAWVFAAAGYTEASAPILKAALLEAAETLEAVPTDADEHGHRYTLDFELHAPRKTVRVRSV